MAAPKTTVTVKAGDTLSAIAKANNTTVAKIAAANPQITNVNVIKPKQVINLPAAKPSVNAAQGIPNAGYTTGSGVNTTTLAGIAAASGTPSPKVEVKPDPDKPDPDNPPKVKKEVSRVKNADGTFTVTYDDGTVEIIGNPTDDGGGPKTWTASDGTVFTDQAAFVAYQTMLNNNARGDYNAAQAAAAKKAQDMADKRDAFALIQDTMKSFGFTDTEVAQLTAFAETQIMDVNIGPNQGILNMKALPVYQARFSGNQTRLKAGKNALSEADYLAQENAYGEYMKAYGVQSLGTRDQFATLIGNDVSATELNKRLNLAVDRVKNSDPEILKQLKTYYPSITDSDLVTYFLKPADALPDLEKKVATSEISAAAVGQGFAADMTGAAALQALGVTREKALTGYQDIKTVLPVSERLSKIYGEAGINYDRAAGESEFLTNSADAAEKRRRLKALERNTFGGQTGVERGTSLNQSSQGRF
jgi:hypothetical protein